MIALTVHVGVLARRTVSANVELIGLVSGEWIAWSTLYHCSSPICTPHHVDVYIGHLVVMIRSSETTSGAKGPR